MLGGKTLKKIVTVLSVILILVLSSVGIIGYLYFLPNSEMVPAFDEGKLNLVMGGEILNDGNPKIYNEEIMLPFDVVKKYIDPNIYWDDKLKKVTVTTKDRVIRMNSGKLNALINNKPIDLKIPVIEEDSIVFVPIGFLSDFYNIEIKYLKEENVIIIDHKDKIKKIAEPVSRKAVIRKGDTIHYPVVKKFDWDKPDDNKMVVFEEKGKWYKVRAADGAIGYIEKKYVNITSITPEKVVETEIKNPAWKPEKGKINLVWEMTYSKEEFGARKEPRIDGLDIISPTWFQVADVKGNLINRASSGYVEWAHKNGYKVWALLSNDFGTPESTGILLNDTDARDNLIKQVLAYAVLYKLDGINIDFENVNKKDKDALTQFVREITPLLKEQGLIVSMDVTIPDGSDNYSLCYDRKAIGEIVDYVALMAYDQHWASSPIAGSVAQITWVEKNLKKVIELVPADKLLLGMPFYTRVWKDEPGKKLTSSAISMDTAKKLLKENNAQVKWDEESGQFYSEYNKDGINNKIWIEDENSINLRSSLVHKYGLAGVASWSKGRETAEVWTVLNRNLKLTGSYQDWVAYNKDKTYVYK
jgi:spore germination protein YaaH